MTSNPPILDRPWPIPIRQPIAKIGYYDSALWTLVILLAVLDVVSTHHGLRLGLVEQNPLARVALTLGGFWSMLVGKAMAILVGIATWRYLNRLRILVPLMYVAIWGFVVIGNIVIVTTF